MIEYVGDPDSANALDLGCGGGQKSHAGGKSDE